MKKNILLFIGIFLSFVSFGQDNLQTAETPDEHEMNRFINGSGNGRLYVFQQPLPEVEGSPYLFEPIIYGDVLTSDSVVIKNVLFRYNIHKDCVEYTKDGKRVNVFAHQILEFRFKQNGKDRVFRNGFQNYVNNYTVLTYYEVLYDGKTKLILKHEKPVMRVNSKINAPGINSNTATKKYVNFNRYYIKKEGKYIPVRLRRKDIKAALGSDDFNLHLKETRNKCRTVENVAKALVYYDKELETK